MRHSRFHRSMILLFAFLLLFSFAAPVAFAGSSDSGAANPDSVFDMVDDTGKITGMEEGDTGSSIADLITKYKSIATGFLGLATITMLIFTIFQFVKLGGTGDNEMARRKAIFGILTTGAATAMLGGLTVVVGFFWNLLV